MENKNIPHPIASITAVKKPRKTYYLSDEYFVIANRNGCYLVNWKTNTIKKQLNNFKDQHLQVYPAQKTIICFCDKKLAKYDISANKESLLTVEKKIQSAAYNPLKESIFLCYGDYTLAGTNTDKNDNSITSYSFLKNRREDIFAPIKNCEYIGINPKQRKIFVGDSFGETALHTTKESTSQWENINLNGWPAYLSCYYSPNGYYIAVQDLNKIDIIEQNSPTEYNKTSIITSNFLGHIMFHPNSVILAVLQQICSTIYYYDIKTKRIIDTLCYDKKNIYDFSFFPNGTKIILTLNDKSIIIPVSLKVILQRKTKKTLFFAWFILQQLKNKQNLSDDIAHYCGNILFNIFKR